eukprot:12924091-Prorocentrum_lima.AAC.1
MLHAGVNHDMSDETTNAHLPLVLHSMVEHERAVYEEPPTWHNTLVRESIWKRIQGNTGCLEQPKW